MPSSSGRPPHARSGADFWSDWTPAARHGACLTLLLVLSLAFFAPVHFGGQGLHGSDIVQWRGMAESVLAYQDSTGADALWATNMFSGMPAYLIKYEKAVPQLDTLVDAARTVAWPTSHFWLLMAGVYLLVFYLTRDHLSSLASGAAYGFTTYIPIILAAGHQTKFVALAYAPFVLLAFAYALRNPRLVSGLLFAGALALQLRANHPQITYYVLMLALVWWIVEAVQAVRAGQTTPFAKTTGWLAMGTGLALLMVVQPYWAIYEYKQFSTRAAQAASAGAGGGNSAMGWEYAMRWSQGVTEMVTLLVADAFGGGQNYWGPKPFTAGPHYVGGAVVALAGLAVWRVRSRITWGLGIGALVTALFAMGRHAPIVNRPMFEVFPFFDAFRAPETWLSITALALVVLAGFGLDYVLRRDDAGRTRKSRAQHHEKTRSMLVAFGVVFGFVALLYVGRSVVFDFEKPNEEQRIVQAVQQQRPDLSMQNPQVQQFIRQEMQKRKEDRQAAFTSDAFRTLFVLGVVALILWLYRRETFAPWLAGVLVFAVVVADLWTVDRRYLGDDAFSPSTRVEREIPTYDVDRWISERLRASGGPGHFRVLPLALNPTNNATPSYHYESLGGYHGAKLQIYQEYLDHILQVGRGAPNENALDLMNARYVVARQQLPGTETVYRGEQTGLLVLRNPDALPRGFLVGQTEVVDGAEATWRRLRDASFDPRQTAVLPEPLDASVTPLDSTSTAHADLVRYTPNEIVWQVETDAPRLFVASEVYYPAGWTATVGGETAPIHRVNYLLRGVHVPAGSHRVVMRFEPTADRVGTWIAALATAVTYGGVVWIVGVPWIRRRFLDPDAEGTRPASDDPESDDAEA